MTLEKSGDIIDIFGKVGEDPGNAWTDDVTAGYAIFRSGAMGRSSTYTLRYSYGSNPLRVAWRLLEGDIMRRMDGEYEFSEVEGQP